MENNLIKDLSLLTTIQEPILEKLLDKVFYVISDDIVESQIKEEEVANCDIGIGTLAIKVCGDDVKFKFIPNAKLKEVVKSTIINKENLLSKVVEKVLIDRVTNTYKDLLR